MTSSEGSERAEEWARAVSERGESREEVRGARRPGAWDPLKCGDGTPRRNFLRCRTSPRAVDADDHTSGEARPGTLGAGDAPFSGDAFPPPPEERGAFVERYARLVHAALHRAVVAAGHGAERNRADLLEDLFAASFVAMFEDDARRLRLWDGRCSRESWLSLIAASVARDHLRAERRRERRLVRDADLQAMADLTEIVDDREDKATARRLLVLALGALAEPDRALLTALVLEEQAPAEVSAALGIAAGALYTRKSRALARLRAAFDRVVAREEGVTTGKEARAVASNEPGAGRGGARQGVSR